MIGRETSRRLCAPQMWSPGAVVIMIEMMVELMVMMEFKLAMRDHNATAIITEQLWSSAKRSKLPLHSLCDGSGADQL